MDKCHRNCGREDSKILDIAREIGPNVAAIVAAKNLKTLWLKLRHKLFFKTLVLDEIVLGPIPCLCCYCVL